MKDSHENQPSGNGLVPFIIFGLGALVGYQVSQSKNRSAQFATEAGGIDASVDPEVVDVDDDDDDDDTGKKLAMRWEVQ